MTNYYFFQVMACHYFENYFFSNFIANVYVIGNSLPAQVGVSITRLPVQR